jgi:hypothetical protein
LDPIYLLSLLPGLFLHFCGYQAIFGFDTLPCLFGLITADIEQFYRTAVSADMGCYDMTMRMPGVEVAIYHVRLPPEPNVIHILPGDLFHLVIG